MSKPFASFVNDVPVTVPNDSGFLSSSSYQRPVAKLSDADVDKYSKLAKVAFDTGHNPAPWVEDEDTWEKAKDAASKTYDKDSDSYWPVVVHIYENMGGMIKKSSKK